MIFSTFIEHTWSKMLSLSIYMYVMYDMYVIYIVYRGIYIGGKNAYKYTEQPTYIHTYINPHGYQQNSLCMFFWAFLAFFSKPAWLSHFPFT